MSEHHIYQAIRAEAEALLAVDIVESPEIVPDSVDLPDDWELGVHYAAKAILAALTRAGALAAPSSPSVAATDHRCPNPAAHHDPSCEKPDGGDCTCLI